MIIASGTGPSSAAALRPSAAAQTSGYGALISFDPDTSLRQQHHAKGQQVGRVAFLGQLPLLTTCTDGEVRGRCAKVPRQHVRRGQDALDAGTSRTVDFSVGGRVVAPAAGQD